MAAAGSADLTRLFVGPGPSGYGTDQVMGALLTAWDPVSYQNTVTDGAYTFHDCIVCAGTPPQLVLGRVLLRFTAGGPVIMGNTFQYQPPAAPAV